jgi:TRAP-type mannitol/chloroaromatic compound transport system substrate-binding protein
MQKAARCAAFCFTARGEAASKACAGASLLKALHRMRAHHRRAFRFLCSQELLSMDRRSLIKRAGIAGVLAAGIAPAVHAQAAVRWRLASSFPKSLDTIFGSAETFARTVKELSGGKFEVSTHAAGELMPAFGVVDAIQNGTIEMAQTAPYYFTGKNPIFAFGCAVPFGLTARQMDSWMEHGNGRKLMDAFYAQYNIKSESAGNTGTQMGG